MRAARRPVAPARPAVPPMPTPLLANLNPEQLEAVTLPHGSSLVLAGAGSGKTRVLTTRIAWLLATGQASPLSVLAVTFTNKAAREMLLRLSALTPMSVRGMWIGTFHGLCNRMLRAHHRDANLPQLFQILDTADQLSLIKRMYKAHDLDDDRFPPKQLGWFIASAKEAGLRPSAVEAGDEFARRQVEHYALYEAMCQREGVVDFAELLLRSYELLAGHEAIRKKIEPSSVRYACPRSRSVATSAAIWGTWSVARGSTSGRVIPSASASARKRAAYRSESSVWEIPSAAAPRMILSSMSVRFMTHVTRSPR